MQNFEIALMKSFFFMSLKLPEKKKLSAVSLKLLEGSAQGERAFRQ